MDLHIYKNNLTLYIEKPGKSRLLKTTLQTTCLSNIELCLKSEFNIS